ncbi:MAG: 23S rRNA (adenine(2503)-C(2))-methyltransferase RlmN [Candidatus Omnitrophica bacterium]|nr:23S rRNA (adenine(2503)-C(2))-methyltransferase RlmN [Candidatus Omnitrophota bacterium]MCM8800030.1 23S rRNA (adenine(2503)-C(2))-methyltransferase RlmN [Candidatus Omnitrophota bacterium]
MKRDIKDLSIEELKQYLEVNGFLTFHALQIFNWIYKKVTDNFSLMTDLSLALRSFLEENFYIQGLSLKEKKISSDNTEKYLFKLKDKNSIETVAIPSGKRITGCLSSQVGCKFSCKFCASGILGFKRDLKVGEIIEQILYLNSHHRLTNIVFMGIGEPLDNYENVLKAIRIINSKEALNFGARRITISTCGIIPAIRKLIEEDLQIELSISLHSPDDKIRSLLMPVNKIYPLRELISICKEYIEKTNRQITFEYVLIKGINSDLSFAEKLSKIAKELKLCKVNLIPANPIKEYNILPPNKLEILYFRDYLLKRKVNVTLRKSRGRDIEAGCGQLRLRYEK